jgi:hypothetical protein
LRAVRSGLGDQRSGDVVAIAAALLDGVGWCEPLPPSVDQQARLGCFRLAPMVPRVRCEPVPNRSPGLIINQRRVLATGDQTSSRSRRFSRTVRS